MNIDRIARAMTSGRPRADFTARVMAPIYGRPRPGFTERVMNGLDAPAAGRAFGPGARAACLLVPAAIALIAGVMAVRASHVDLPAAPIAPHLTTAPAFSPATEAPPQVALDFRLANDVAAFSRARRAAQAVRPAEEPVAPPEPSPIYMIAALDGPDAIAMKSIEPAECTIPALDAPAPLKVADLKSVKEKP